MNIKEISNSLNWKKSFGDKYAALIDSAANQRTLASTKSVAELFYDEGINVDTNVNKDILAGISVVKSYLKSSDGSSRLFIFKTCTNLIRELKTYFWGNGDRPIKSDDHCLDELRYYIMSIDEKFSTNQSEPILLSFKNNLAKKLANERRKRIFK